MEEIVYERAALAWRSFAGNTVLVRQSCAQEAGATAIQTRLSPFLCWVNPETGRAPPFSNSRVATSQSRTLRGCSLSKWTRSSAFISPQLIASLRKWQGLRAANRTMQPAGRSLGGPKLQSHRARAHETGSSALALPHSGAGLRLVFATCAARRGSSR